MQQKLCLWLVVAVLFGALAAGNPWLVERASGADGDEERRGAPAPRADAVRDSDRDADRDSDRVSALADAAVTGGPATEARPAAGAADRRRAEPAFQPGPRAAPAVQPVALRAGAPDALLPFPDASRRPLVRALEFDADGGPVWVMHDGRRYVPNPRAGGGEPAVVELRPALPEK